MSLPTSLFQFLLSDPSNSSSNACHSEGFSDLPFRYDPMDSTWCTDWAKPQALPKAHIFYFAAALGHETAADLGRAGGAMTIQVLELLGHRHQEGDDDVDDGSETTRDQLFKAMKALTGNLRMNRQVPSFYAYPTFRDFGHFAPFDAAQNARYLLAKRDLNNGGQGYVGSGKMVVPSICLGGGHDQKYARSHVRRESRRDSAREKFMVDRRLDDAEQDFSTTYLQSAPRFTTTRPRLLLPEQPGVGWLCHCGCNCHSPFAWDGTDEIKSCTIRWQCLDAFKRESKEVSQERRQNELSRGRGTAGKLCPRTGDWVCGKCQQDLLTLDDSVNAKAMKEKGLTDDKADYTCACSEECFSENHRRDLPPFDEVQKMFNKSKTSLGDDIYDAVVQAIKDGSKPRWIIDGIDTESDFKEKVPRGVWKALEEELEGSERRNWKRLVGKDIEGFQAGEDGWSSWVRQDVLKNYGRKEILYLICRFLRIVCELSANSCWPRIGVPGPPQQRLPVDYLRDFPTPVILDQARERVALREKICDRFSEVIGYHPYSIVSHGTEGTDR